MVEPRILLALNLELRLRKAPFGITIFFSAFRSLVGAGADRVVEVRRTAGQMVLCRTAD
jgi:hypothetical protein